MTAAHIDRAPPASDADDPARRGKRRAGIVLAGGHSDRFGDPDEALAELHGETLLSRVDGGGPVVGLAAALRCCRAPVVVIAACDNPLVSPALLDALCSELDGRDGVIPRVDGVLQPTQAAF